MVLNLNFGEGCGCSSLEVDVPIDFMVRPVKIFVII